MKTQYTPVKGNDPTLDAIETAHARGRLNAWIRNFNVSKVRPQIDNGLKKSKAPALREALHAVKTELEAFLGKQSANGVGLAGVSAIRAIHAAGPGLLSKATGLPPQSSNGFNDDVTADDGAQLAEDAVEDERTKPGIRNADPTVAAIKRAQRKPKRFVPATLLSDLPNDAVDISL